MEEAEVLFWASNPLMAKVDRLDMFFTGNLFPGPASLEETSVDGRVREVCCLFRKKKKKNLQITSTVNGTRWHVILAAILAVKLIHFPVKVSHSFRLAVIMDLMIEPTEPRSVGTCPPWLRGHLTENLFLLLLPPPAKCESCCTEQLNLQSFNEEVMPGRRIRLSLAMPRLTMMTYKIPKREQRKQPTCTWKQFYSTLCTVQAHPTFQWMVN